MQLTSSVKELKGIGDKTAKLFEKLGIYTIQDLIEYYPRAYEEYTEPVSIDSLTQGQTAVIRGTVSQVKPLARVRNLQILQVMVQNGSRGMLLTWYNMPYLRSTLKPGSTFLFRGAVILKNGRLTMEQPTVYKEEEYEAIQGRLLPIYPLTAGITNNIFRKAVKQIIEQLDLEKEYLPLSIRKKYSLAEYNYAVQSIHFPKDRQDCIFARRRLVFDEFLFFMLSVRSMKEKTSQVTNEFPFASFDTAEHIVNNLPYQLTNAQQKVWAEIKDDLTRDGVMNRLIQGDVGSGKTILAMLAMISAAENSYQSALMVPTEVLARQHFESFQELKEQFAIPFEAVLLTGSMKASEKKSAREAIFSGQATIVIGTHTLFQEKVQYEKLGLVITDEQHRFGVKQREDFSGKGELPHILVMSATPIPRTLAIIVYGDLDVSVIDELPSNRVPIKNCVVDTGYRRKAYDFITKEVNHGHQAYVICPMVEESEKLEAENVTDYEKELRQELPSHIRTGILHGKMKPAEKNEVMERFAANEIQVLVSTTVVEVGVNVPNATVMMIENAERFGLAQLHQLRGRVGRGKDQSYCILVCGSGKKESMKRLEILRDSNDGFYIASEDLKLRGPGDIFGMRQSGDMLFKLGDIYTDSQVLKQASDAAALILDNKNYNDNEDYQSLWQHFERNSNLREKRMIEL